MTHERPNPVSPEDRRRFGWCCRPDPGAAGRRRRVPRRPPDPRSITKGLARDIDAYRREYPPIVDPELVEALAGLRRKRERRGSSLTDMAERTGIDRATISKLETGKLANPTIGTLRTYARAGGG